METAKTADVKWGISPPRYSGQELLYSQILVVAIVGTDIIGAERFDLDGTSTPVPIIDVSFNTLKMKQMDSIVTKEYLGKLANIDSNIRASWLFNTKEEAFLQKLILLDHLKDHFLNSQQEAKRIFAKKIPEDIHLKLEQQLEKYPELML